MSPCGAPDTAADVRCRHQRTWHWTWIQQPPHSSGELAMHNYLDKHLLWHSRSKLESVGFRPSKNSLYQSVRVSVTEWQKSADKTWTLTDRHWKLAQRVCPCRLSGRCPVLHHTLEFSVDISLSEISLTARNCSKHVKLALDGWNHTRVLLIFLNLADRSDLMRTLDVAIKFPPFWSHCPFL